MDTTNRLYVIRTLHTLRQSDPIAADYWLRAYFAQFMRN